MGDASDRGRGGRQRRGWFTTSRRRFLGSLLLATGWCAGGMGLKSFGQSLEARGRVLLDRLPDIPPGLEAAMKMPLVEAIYGRRSRRFSYGAEVPDGPLKFKSRHDPVPLSDLEKMLLLTAAAGNTGWHYMIYRHELYAPHLSNYSAAAGGRSFPSPAGWHVSNFFFTDDDGVYYFDTRDAPSLVDRDESGAMDLHAWLEAHRERITKLADGRLHLPAREPHMDGHNTWCVNRPGSMLIIPVVDLAQSMLNTLSFLVTNRISLYDDINDQPVPGLDQYGDLIDLENPWPLSVVEQETLTMATAEMSAACYAGTLMLQAMGLGGWMFSGVDMFSVLGASGDPKVPGLGFRYDTDERWPVPNVTGLPGVYEGLCPPHYQDMAAAVEALARRKFGEGGPFNAETGGPWKDTAQVRSSAKPYTDDHKGCVATMAQYIYDRFGKFPGTLPTMYILTYLQAHHLDLDFYDQHYEPGAYLHTHADHMQHWHP